MRRGDIYNLAKIEQALKNFFRLGNLIALRELALRQVAEQVDKSLETYMTTKDIHGNWPVRERILVCVSANPKAQYLIARASRMARRMDGELHVLHVDLKRSNDDDPKVLDSNLEFARNLGAKVARMEGNSVSEAAAAFVREKHITQAIFGRSAVEGWRKFAYMSAINRFLRDAPAVDVHIVTQEPD
jgi:two-component system sensor histidine kinase KdpD